MSSIKKSFKTKYTAMEMKNYISSNLLPNPTLSSLMESTQWDNNTLYINSKIGNGTIELNDYKVDINIQLTLFGTLTKRALESSLDKEFKQLN